MSTTNEKNSVTVTILDRDFNIKCPSENIADLHKAAKYLDNKIREIKKIDINTLDRLLATAALNIIHELFTQKKQNLSYMNSMNQEIIDLQNKLESALEDRAY